MSRIPVKYIGLFSLVALLGGLSQSCTESQQDTPDWVTDKSGILFRTELREGVSDNGLLTKLYVFSKTAGDADYKLTDSLSEVIDGETRLKLNLKDLREREYRFLFIGTSEQKPEMAVKHADDLPLDLDTPWEKIAIGMTTDSLSVNNYYGIKDLSGTDIMKMESINGELSRLVGQMVFCFYKVQPGGMDPWPSIDDPKVASVLDRISSIDITYQGVARAVRFDENNLPITQPGTEKELNNTVRFSLSKDSLLTVNIPQEGVPVEKADSIHKGAILQGACLPPSQAGIRVSMTFHYYDTTPVCEELHASHEHTVKCYTLSSLSLNLPKDKETPGLSVLPDYFTINNAGLPCNRVIDIQYESDFKLETDWK